MIEKGKNAASRIFDKNGADQSIQTPEWINKINPGFNESRDPGFKMNCGNCALAFELQSRGISASAKSNGFGLTKEQLMSNLKNVDSHTILDLDKLNVPPLEWSEQGTRQRGEKVQRRIAQSIAEAYKSSDTARGTLFVPGPLGSHYVSWMKSGSNVKFFNRQDPARDLVSSCFGMYAGEQGDPTFSLTAIRLDNLDFDTDKLKDLVNL